MGPLTQIQSGSPKPLSHGLSQNIVLYWLLKYITIILHYIFCNLICMSYINACHKYGGMTFISWIVLTGFRFAMPLDRKPYVCSPSPPNMTPFGHLPSTTNYYDKTCSYTYQGPPNTRQNQAILTGMVWSPSLYLRSTSVGLHNEFKSGNLVSNWRCVQIVQYFSFICIYKIVVSVPYNIGYNCFENSLLY